MTVQVLGASPPESTAIEATRAVQFDVRNADPTPVGEIVVVVRFPGFPFTELAYIGDPSSSIVFEPLYAAQSSVVQVLDTGFQRFRFVLDRDPVWPDSFTISVYSSAGASLIIIQDEGVPQGVVDTVNFTGAGVAATVGGTTATVNIPGSTVSPGGAPVNVTKAAADAGVAATFSRSDHKHDISTGVPVAVGLANAEGSASSLARSDHVHADPSSKTFYLTLSGSLTAYDLATACPGIKSGDKVAIELTGDLTINTILIPYVGFWCWWGIRDLTGGEWRMTFKDSSGATGFRTPGAPESTDVGPDFIMSSGEDWTAIGATDPDAGLGFLGGWRILCRNSNTANNGLSTVGGPGIPARFAVTANTVALYHFDQTLNDSSGNGLTINTGTPNYISLYPNVNGLQGAAALSRAAFDAALAITGDITLQCIIRLFTSPNTTNTTIASFTAAGETLATNTLWLFALVDSGRCRWLSESGAGVDAEYFTASNPTFQRPPLRDPFHFAVTRVSNVVQFYLNGVAFGSPSGVLVAPAGGTSSTLIVNSGGGDWSCMGLRIENIGKTAAQIKADYNATMGVAYGNLS